ncbi:MAG TPA: ParB/RepB/Spo0J family partition protein [Candidatus Nanoarchaeia archaeon]|nr:ParB/RepB/Spo0J family partition protein [Candidatus Nanoarchaeia archaeon]
MAYGLGRGLSSLIPPKKEKSNAVIREDEYFSSPAAVLSDGVLQVDPNQIEANPMQPRKSFGEAEINELAESIKTYGIIQPLIATKKGGRYELIAGERRLRAAKVAGLSKVPVIVRDYDEQKKLEVALVENLQREDLNPIDRAGAYRQLMADFNLTVEEAAKKVGKSRPQVSNTLRLLSLPAEIRAALSGGKLSEAHAIYLLGLDNEVKQLNVFRKILRNDWTVRETSRQVRRIGGTKESRIKDDPADAVREAAFRSFFGAKTEIKRANRGGKIIIDFYSDDELAEMTRKIKN